MKKRLLLGFCLLLVGIGYSQSTPIPDDNFEQALIDLGIDTNTTPDNQVLDSDIANVTFLNLTGDPIFNTTQSEIGLNIQDLTGIKSFTSLETLWVQGNSLLQLDLERMSTIKDVRAFFNDLESININGLTNLEIIGLNVNNLTGINVSTNTSLTILDIAQNNLSNLDIRGLNSLISGSFQNNTQLNCILVENTAIANSYNSNVAFLKNSTTQFSADCNLVYDVQVSVPEVQEIDANGFHVIRAANAPIVLQFNAVDANGQDLNATLLSDYDLTITTLPDPNRNPAAGGDISVAGIDFELLNNVNQNVAVQNGQIDFSRPIQMRGDSAFEADEYFIVQVTSNDPDVNLSNSANGVVTFPVRIIDNEKTNINFEIIRNGIEATQHVQLRISSSLANNTGAPIPFRINFQDISAIYGADYVLENNIINIVPGDSDEIFDISTPNDAIAEDLKSFTATISYEGDLDPDRFIFQTSSVEPTIIDDGDVNETPFTVSATITNAGTAPNYVIEEGQSFELNFDTGNTGTNDLIYSPVVSITKDSEEVNDDFSVDVLGKSFVIIPDNPDGNILFTAIDDGVNEGDETYFITITSEDTSRYNTTEVPISFEVVIKDKVGVENNEIRVFLTNAGENENYSVIEGNTFKLNFEALNPELEGNTVGLSIDTSKSSATGFSYGDSDFIQLESSFSFEISDTNPDKSIAFSVLLDEFENENEEIIISLDKPNGEYQWENANADGTFDLIITIEDTPQTYTDIPISISLEGQSGPNFSISEGQNVVFKINGTNSTYNGQSATLFYTYNSGTANGFPDTNAISKDSPFLVDFSINDPDSTFEIEIREDDKVNEGENLIVTFFREGNYIFENASSDGSLTFDIKIEDINITPNPEAQIEIKPFFRNSDNILAAIEPSSSLKLKEGEGLDLSFDLKNLESTETGSYGLRIQTQNGTAKSEDGDFEKVDEIFIIDTKDGEIDVLPGINSFDDLVEILNDGSLNETDETFFLEITPVTSNNVRLVDFVSNINGELLAIGQTLRFEIIIENGELYGSDPFEFSITPHGDVTGNEVNNNLTIKEGEIIELWVDAQVPNKADGYSFQLEPLFDPKFAGDIEIIENNPIVVNNNKSPDGIIKIKITEDAVVDEDELIGLIFENQNLYSFTNTYNFNGETFRYIPFTVKNISSAEYYAIWDNKGSLEGGIGNNQEVITLELKNKDGTPYATDIDLEFDLVFDNMVDNPADEGEYPTNTKIKITAGNSIGNLRYNVPMDQTNETDEHEFYQASISNSSGNTLEIDLPEPLLIKILDSSQPYVVFVQPKTKQSTNPIYKSSSVEYANAGNCCPQFRIPEGSNYEVTFEAEKGVPEQEIFTVDVDFYYSGGPDGSGGTSSTKANEAKEGLDFKNQDPDNMATYEVKLDKNKPDNTLIISIFDDEVEERNGNLPGDIFEELEKFELLIELGETSNNNFILTEVILENPAAFTTRAVFPSMRLPFQKVDILIDQVIPLTLEVINNEINEENHENDFARVKLKRLNDNSDFLGEVNLVIFTDLTNDASEGLDYEPIVKSVTLGNNLELEIFIKALPDGIADNNERIRIGIAPGDGYSFSAENIVTITITDEDVSDFDASINVPTENQQLFEDATLGPTTGVFEVTLSNSDDSAPNENILVSFIINDEEEQPQEGIDYKIFDGQGDDKREITNTDQKYVTIKQGATKGYITIEVVQNDGIIESPESVQIQLITGLGYNLNQNSNEGEIITIISKEQDTTELDPSDITARVTSSTCPGVNEGRISMANDSPFDFTVNLYNFSNKDKSIGSEALIRNTIEPIILFDNLKAGTYEIRLTVVNKEDIIPPTFTVTVRDNLASSQLLSSSLNLESKVANLVVSGSRSYEVGLNGRSYSFRFDSNGPNKLEIPVNTGSNQITILGEAECQGKIQKEIFFSDYKVFPNPVASSITFEGFIPSSEIKVFLYDTSGRLIISHKEVLDISGGFEMDVDFLSKGTYFGKILSAGEKLMSMKLIKK